MGPLVGHPQGRSHVPQPVVGQVRQQLTGDGQVVQGVVFQGAIQVLLEGVVEEGGVKAHVVAQQKVLPQKIPHQGQGFYGQGRALQHLVGDARKALDKIVHIALTPLPVPQYLAPRGTNEGGEFLHHLPAPHPQGGHLNQPAGLCGQAGGLRIHHSIVPGQADAALPLAGTAWFRHLPPPSGSFLYCTPAAPGKQAGRKSAPGKAQGRFLSPQPPTIRLRSPSVAHRLPWKDERFPSPQNDGDIAQQFQTG